MAVGRSFRLVFLPPQRSRAIPPSLPPWQQPRVRSRYEKGPSAPPLPLRSFSFLRPRGLFSGKIWRLRRRLYSAVCALLCVATAAFSRPSVAEWSGAITFGLLTHSLRVFLRRRRRRQCLVTMDGSWRWSCGGVGREGPAPLRPPPHFGGGGTAASCDSSTDRPRRSMRPLHASPSFATRIISRLHSALFLQAPRSTSERRELHCTLPHIPWNNKRGAAAALLFVLSSKWAACAMCVDVHPLSSPAPKVGRSRLSSRRRVEYGAR